MEYLDIKAPPGGMAMSSAVSVMLRRALSLPSVHGGIGRHLAAMVTTPVQLPDSKEAP